MAGQDPTDRHWVLEYERFDPAVQPKREALLTLGNGTVATRGAAEEAATIPAPTSPAVTTGSRPRSPAARFGTRIWSIFPTGSASISLDEILSFLRAGGTRCQKAAEARMGGMGTRSAPMDGLTHHAQLVHGRPPATHATRFGTMVADIESQALTSQKASEP